MLRFQVRKKRQWMQFQTKESLPIEPQRVKLLKREITYQPKTQRNLQNKKEKVKEINENKKDMEM